jgi:NAD(P)-dependent dehydrogenase (short-subunit alcohol dehydrogenase family)
MRRFQPFVPTPSIGSSRPEADPRHQLRGIPVGRRGDPNEIAQAAVFLASDEGAFAVGSEFIIDGGDALM